MTKWLWSIAIVCLLATGCGISKSKPYHDQRYTQDSDGQEDPVINKREKAAGNEHGVESSILDERPNSTPWATTTVLPTPTSVPTTSPETQPSPVVTQSPKPKATPKKATPSPESKKPSVPVQQNQGRAKIAQKKLTLSQLAIKYPETFKLRGSSHEKKVALTFDDGPDTKFTPKVLDALKAHHVKATFFLLGSKANAHPDMVRRIVNEGHVIGNHSYSHANLPTLSVDGFQSQIEQTENVLQNLIGYTPKLIRPPYGAINEEQVKWVADHHYLIVNWNVDSLDWKSLKSAQVLQNIMQQTKPGSIILQHSGGADSQDLSGTVQAIEPLIRKLKTSGYSFVTVPELLHVPKSK
ncbi:polysaccharide deacetylase family protein [Paenibacillus sp. SYP-B3998]|uniref:Polysaccharide deacetylase family protein n=1 Tax=Paenibacillus sp. SYP-B3998 TaxID=2678564 RepID=A0A6G3ZTP8_9BACL|nr:polysaccharide deacetylase family protein [Paenibacillus sp. SYP-B3998]NEW05495.1 polysaccharide deacetylase family protein [Paenibacillus sp. SYP-B3998]